MKKSILQFSVIAAIAASMTLTTSCSSDDGTTAYVPEALKFSVAHGGMAITRATAETAVAQNSIDEKWASGDKIAIYTKDADEKYYLKGYTLDAADNTGNQAIAVTKQDNSESGDFYWKGKNETKVFEAFSYGESTGTVYTPNITNTTLTNGSSAYNLTFDPMIIDADQSTGLGKEFLYMYGRVAYQTGTINIPLNHQLTRIDVRLLTKKRASELTGVTKLYIGKEGTQHGTTPTYNDGIVIEGTFQRPTAFNNDYKTGNTTDLVATGKFGTWTLATTGTNLNKRVTPRVLTEEAAGTETGETDYYLTVYSAIVIPQSFEHTYMFVINYDGAEYIYTGLAADDLSAGAGNKYTYTIKIDADELDVSTAQITPWVSQTKTATAVLQ